ncbi:hypothetical protein QQF64_028767 [Cirrhinus molitorella]|uniref:Uncharacterized protein n=2 Tax=Cirrhinus molitorella TaxID=172907 RepID=A0ABR3N855_9TELE|nr:hypothetical protein Q8A67_014521 [Cirrhinus molitorella]
MSLPLIRAPGLGGLNRATSISCGNEDPAEAERRAREREGSRRQRAEEEKVNTRTRAFPPDEWRLGEEPETSALEGGQRGAVETGHRRHEWLDCRGVADPTASHPCTGTKDTSLESRVTFRANIAQSS